MAHVGHDIASLGPWIHHYGVVAVFLILTLESFGLPLPGESLLVTTAILAGRGEISFVGLVFAAWAGAVTGDNIGYLGGRVLGRRALARFGEKIGLHPERLRKVEAVFARHGPVTVVFARFFAVLRQLNGVVAGTMEMRWGRFLVFNAIGGALWVLTWISIGFCLGSYGVDVAAAMRKLGFLAPAIALAAIVIVLLFIAGRRLYARHRREDRPRRKRPFMV